MSDYDRDGNVERQQIHEIALNVARRLLKVLEIGRAASPALAADIDATARVISDIQHDVEHVMSMQPFGATLDMSVLTHILGSQQHALGLLEQLEKRTQGYGPAAASAQPAPQAYPAPQDFSRAENVTWPQSNAQPDGFFQPESYAQRENFAQPHGLSQPQSFADALRFGASQGYAAASPYPTAPVPRQAPRPDSVHRPAQGQNVPQPGMPPRTAMPNGAPPQAGPAPFYSGPAAQRPREAGPRAPQPQQQGQSAPRQHPAAGGQPRAAKAAFRMTDFATLGARMSEPKFAAAAATLVVVIGSLVGAFTLLPAPSTGKPSNAAPGQKLDGRLDSETAAPTMRQTPAQQFAAVTPDPNSMEQPYLVVLATRASTDELQKDFQGFNQAYPDLLSGRRARVDLIQGQDQKTWHRLSLIPPQSQADAKDLCAKLKAAGLTGCWIRRVPLMN